MKPSKGGLEQLVTNCKGQEKVTGPENGNEFVLTKINSYKLAQLMVAISGKGPKSSELPKHTFRGNQHKLRGRSVTPVTTAIQFVRKAFTFVDKLSTGFLE